MELICAWWNCRLSPPKNGAKTYPITDGFTLAVCELLRRGVDILGLCEVSRANFPYLEELLGSQVFGSYKVLDLYTAGKSIDDFCLIYNSEKISVVAPPESANVRDHLTGKWLKAGVFVRLNLAGSDDLFVALSHWQSRQTYSEGSTTRLKLGQALRAKVSEITDESPEVPIILLGDYNDEPYHESIVSGLGASRDVAFVHSRPSYFYNPYWGCLSSHDSRLPAGSYVHPSAIEASGGAVYDQIMFSSHFLRDWKFKLAGVIVGDIQVSEFKVNWGDVSDHYPVLSHLMRV